MYRQLLAVAGYDCKLTLYETKSFKQLDQIPFKPIPGGPPPFIWSCDFSPDGSHLVVGCWNARSY